MIRIMEMICLYMIKICTDIITNIVNKNLCYSTIVLIIKHNFIYFLCLLYLCKVYLRLLITLLFLVKMIMHIILFINNKIDR